MDRIELNDYFLFIARWASLRSTCIRRTVGCVLVNSRNRIISTGYNGNLPKRAHCITTPCAGALDNHGDCHRCEAVHAELNAVLHCESREKVETAYCTDSPCRECAMVLASLPGLKAVHYVRKYTDEGIEVLERSKIMVLGHPLAYSRPMDQLMATLERGRNHDRSETELHHQGCHGNLFQAPGGAYAVGGTGISPV